LQLAAAGAFVVRFTRAEIRHLERQAFSGPKMALLVGGTLVVAFTLAFAAALGSIMGGGY
jgi:hypothetical protein